MDFKGAMQHSLKIDKRTHTDPFLLHSRVCDLVGNDYEAKKAAEEFYRLDAKYEISKTILGSAPIKYRPSKKLRYHIKHPVIPSDNTYVFFSDNTSLLHLSGECPVLKGETRIYRSTYIHAKILNIHSKYLSKRSWFYKTRHRRSIARLFQVYHPHICRRCGDFMSKQTNSVIYRLAQWLFEHLHIDWHRKSNYSPTSLALFKSFVKAEKEKIMKLFLYHRVKKYIFRFETINEIVLQQKFNISNAEATKIMRRLEDDERIMYAKGNWYVLYGLHHRRPGDVIRIATLPEVGSEFTERNVLCLLEHKNFLSSSLLQRTFRVGSGTAAKMLDDMGQKGFIRYDGQYWRKHI